MYLAKLTTLILLAGCTLAGAQPAAQHATPDIHRTVAYQLSIVESNQEGVVSKRRYVLIAQDGHPAELPITALYTYPLACDPKCVDSNTTSKSVLVRVTPKVGIGSIASNISITSPDSSVDTTIDTVDGGSAVVVFGDPLPTNGKEDLPKKHRYAMEVTARAL